MGNNYTSNSNSYKVLLSEDELITNSKNQLEFVENRRDI